MASAGKRGGGGERVLESRHVIGLFLLMLLFSGVFFTLGYVMGRNQNDGQLRAATDFFKKPEISASRKPDSVSKHSNNTAPAGTPAETAAPANSDWEFYHAGENKKTEDHLKPAMPAAAPAPERKGAPVLVKTAAPPKMAGGPSKSMNAPFIPGGSYIVQVAALTKESDALELAARLQKKKFPAFVLSPRTDKFYRVQVGPYADLKAADAARKGVESVGFKAIVKH